MAEEKRSKISVVVLTFNSEIHIKDCLESAKWADEIVVVDSFSSDDTIKIARQYTDKIWQRQWPGFAAQWNFAIEQAAGEWLFILASDEIITAELKYEIGNVIANNNSASGHFVSRKTYFLNKWIRHCGWYPDHSIRFIKKGAGRFDESKLVHETININGKTAYLKNPILHYSFSNVYDYVQRLNNYTSLAVLQMVNGGVKIKGDEIIKKAAFKAFKIFWNMYIRQAGFKDGMQGLFLSFFSSAYRFITYVKYWEITIRQNG